MTVWQNAIAECALRVEDRMDIPLSRPDITQAERDAVNQVMLTPQLSLGPKLAEFEAIFTRYIGTRHAVAVSSGTSGLHLCLRAMGVGPGDEVITTPFSFIASANCILFDGARPVFADVDPDTWNIDPARIADAITPRTRAIIPVDVFGQPAEMATIRELADRHGLRILEDSCEALGATYRGRKAGSLGDAGVFGFYPNKQITTGEGGMIVTSDEDVYNLAVSMRNQGRDVGMGWLAHARIGYNYRLSDINCALGLAQMNRVDEIIANRQRVADYYLERLAEEPRIRMQMIHPDCRISWFVMVVRLADEYSRDDRDRIVQDLRAAGIGSSNYFPPIHLQPFYIEQFGHKPGDLPVCEALCDRTVALPFHGHLTEDQVETVCRQLRAQL